MKRRQKRREDRREDRRWLVVSQKTSIVSGMRPILWMHRPTQRWMYVCLWRWIGDQIHFRRMSGLPRESLMRAPSTSINRNNIDLNPRTGPDLNSPDTICHYRTFSGLRRIDLDRGWLTQSTLELSSANKLPGLCHPTEKAAQDFRARVDRVHGGRLGWSQTRMMTACQENVMTRVVRRDCQLGTVGRSGLQTLR